MILVRVRRDFHLGLETAEKCGKKSRLGFSCKLLLTVLCFHKVAKNKPDIRSVKNLTWILLVHDPTYILRPHHHVLETKIVENK